MSHEETVVRTAYARLAYAAQLDVVYHLSSRAWEQQNPPLVQADMDRDLANGQITFRLSNFVTGNTADIFQKPIGMYVSPEPASVLKTTFTGHSIQEGGLKTPSQFFSADLHWSPGNSSASDLQVMVQAITMAAAFALEDPSAPPAYETYPRYAAFLATVTYMGVTAGPYKALFLFGKDAAGKELIRPMDTTVQIGLATALGTPLYPKALVETNRRRLSVIDRWLDATRMEDSCSQWQQDVCCNLEALRCGMTAAMLQTARSKPLPPATWKIQGER